MAVSDPEEHFTKNGESIPPIMCPDNKPIWTEVRRLMIWILRLLKRCYGYPTIEI